MTNKSNARENPIRRLLFLHLDAESWPRPGLSHANKLITVLVLTSVISAIIETEQSIATQFENFFEIGNKIFLYAFTIEYVIRIWSMGERKEYSGLLGRLRFAVTPMALVDLVAVAPFWFGVGSEILLIRILRILRILKLAKIPGVSQALSGILTAVSRRRFELLLSVGLALFLLIVAASILYLVERNVQPEAFGSIPRALWWGMATLTTVGYGDVYPITALGRIAAGIFAFAGIGLVAMPTGILAAALSDGFRRAEESRTS